MPVAPHDNDGRMLNTNSYQVLKIFLNNIVKAGTMAVLPIIYPSGIAASDKAVSGSDGVYCD
jgi:hypothetical protein